MFLGDLGLSQVIAHTNIMGTMLAGSPGFQSPEQLRNESDIGLPSDICAYGAVLIVLFGESPVWPGLLPYQITYKVAVDKENPNIGHLPESIQNICHKCFSDISLRPKANMILMDILKLT